jgi:hypothetical protein
VLLARLEEDAVTGTDHLDRAAAPLAGPTPSVTQIVWPFGCVCQCVRAPGVKWTLLALTREAPAGAATASTYTDPVNQSVEPAAASTLFLVICMPFLLVECGGPAAEQVQRLLRLRAGVGRVDEHRQPGVGDELHGFEREVQLADDRTHDGLLAQVDGYRDLSSSLAVD